MVTAKKASTPEPAAVAAPAIAKPVAAKKPAAKTTAKAQPKSAKPAAAARSKLPLNAEQRNHYVEVAAFYIAERRGFVPGNPADDWCAAELEVDRLIASGHFN